MQFVYIILAIFGLSFLVFIHELGHYIVARMVGMRVEAFSIGFGRPILSWMRNGVQWQIGILPFGGFVKIAGMEKEGEQEPHDIKDGFFGKPPLARIQVALAGPIVNIVFALLVFGVIWGMGGRAKPFHEYTNIIGYVDPSSTLYEKGVHPGDTITTYNNKPFSRYQDLLMASVSNATHAQIAGEQINYYTGEKTPYSMTLPVYNDPRMAGDDFKTIGVLSPASFLVVEGAVDPLSPMYDSGVQSGDRIVWADGSLVFSRQQLSSLINDGYALLTITRNGAISHVRVPRMPLSRFETTSFLETDLRDWQFVNKQHDKGVFIPYEVSSDCVVTKPLAVARVPSVDETFVPEQTETVSALQVGDTILAVDGTPLTRGPELFKALQEKKVLLMVNRGMLSTDIPLDTSGQAYIQTVPWKDVGTMAETIGTATHIKQSGSVVLLQPIKPIPMKAYPFSAEERSAYDAALSSFREKVEAEQSGAKRQEMLAMLKQQEEQLVLGVPLHDGTVLVNPGPFTQMGKVLTDMGRTLSSVTTGQISAKWMSGPVGIMQMMQFSWSQGAVEALYWIGVISLNLGILNLLPIPVLDGGHIVISLYEMVTRRRVTAKTMQRLILPFAVLLIAFFVYVTYHDIMRLL